MLKKIFKFKLIILVTLLSVISSIVSFYPLMLTTRKTILFNFEPDVPYVANAFRYIYSHKILYDGHPGTPSIVSLAYAFTPIRLYTKFFVRTPFLLWSIRNIRSIFYYSRLFQNLIFGLSIIMFLLATYNLTRNYLSIFVSWFGLFVFRYIPKLGLIIQSETLSLLILSMWFFVFSKFVSKRNFSLYLILCALSGFAVANKLTNVFYIFASIFLILTFKDRTLKIKLNKLVKGVSVSLVAFIFGTWPIRDSYIALLGWIKRLALYSGVYGSGEKTLFNLNEYVSSLNSIYIDEMPAVILVISIILIWIVYIRKKYTVEHKALTILLLSMVTGMLVFGKYSLVHYQIPLYIGVLFVASYLCSRLNKPIQIIIIGTFAVLSLNTVQIYWESTFNEIRGTLVLENFIEKNPPKVATVWEWGKAADYTLLHIRDWSGNPFSSILREERPNLYSLTIDMSKVVLYYDKSDDLFNVCWDQLYIQGAVLDKFLEKYKERKFEVKQILGSTRNMYLVTSNHCEK